MLCLDIYYDGENNASKELSPIAIGHIAIGLIVIGLIVIGLSGEIKI